MILIVHNGMDKHVLNVQQVHILDRMEDVHKLIHHVKQQIKIQVNVPAVMQVINLIQQENVSDPMIKLILIHNVPNGINKHVSDVLLVHFSMPEGSVKPLTHYVKPIIKQMVSVPAVMTAMLFQVPLVSFLKAIIITEIHSVKDMMVQFVLNVLTDTIRTIEDNVNKLTHFVKIITQQMEYVYHVMVDML